MKKIALSFLLLFVSITLFTCENEPLDGFDLNGVNPSSNNLLGTWTLANFDYSVNSSTVIGGITIASNTEIISENPNYDLTFLPSTFSTNGSYGYIVDITVNGQNNTQTLAVDNVAGVGNYTTNGSEITSDASFVSYMFQGMDLSDLQGEQTAPYTISTDGQTLTFIQNLTETNTDNDVTTTSIIVSSSVWTKVATSNNPCLDATAFAATAESQYSNDISNENLCNAYKSALQNQIAICGDATGEIQAIINGLGDCSNSSVSIIGVWQLISETEDDVELVLTECELLQTIEFNATEYIDNWQFSSSGNAPCQSGTNIDSYTINSNIVTVNDSVEPFDLEIVSVTQTTLVLKYIEEFGGNSFVFIETYTRL